MQQDADAIILSPHRERFFGILCECAAAAMGEPPGFIVLKYGLATARGFGLQHIKSKDDRVRSINGLGYSSVNQFVHDVCQRWTIVLRGKDGKYILVWQTRGFDLAVVLDRRNNEWSITTAMANRVVRGEKIYERVRAEESEPPRATTERTHFETLSLPKKSSSVDKAS